MPIFGFLLSSALSPHPSSLTAGLFLSGTLIRMNDLLCTKHVCFPFINLLFSIAYDKIIRCDRHVIREAAGGGRITAAPLVLLF